MDDGIRLATILSLRPVAAIAGFGLGYGLGKLVCGIYNKIDDYCYYKRRRG